MVIGYLTRMVDTDHYWLRSALIPFFDQILLLPIALSRVLRSARAAETPRRDRLLLPKSCRRRLVVVAQPSTGLKQLRNKLIAVSHLGRMASSAAHQGTLQCQLRSVSWWIHVDTVELPNKYLHASWHFTVKFWAVCDLISENQIRPWGGLWHYRRSRLAMGNLFIGLSLRSTATSGAVRDDLRSKVIIFAWSEV